HLRNGDERLLVLGLAAAAEIELAGFRIGADHDEVGADPERLVAGAGRQDRDVAGREVDLLALVAAEADLGAAARDADPFVDHRVIMHIRVNPVAPAVAPAMTMEGFFD